jgi:hypothetical protein
MYSVPCKVTTTLLQVLSSLPLPLSLQNLVVLNMLRPLQLMIVFPRSSPLHISPESDQADLPLMFMHQGCAVSVAARLAAIIDRTDLQVGAYAASQPPPVSRGIEQQSVP